MAKKYRLIKLNVLKKQIDEYEGKINDIFYKADNWIDNENIEYYREGICRRLDDFRRVVNSSIEETKNNDASI